MAPVGLVVVDAERWHAPKAEAEQFLAVCFGDFAPALVFQGFVDEIARQAGVTPQQASTGLSELLPEVVNHVTPDGQVPDLDQLTASVSDLSRRFGLA